jgi:subtilisin family serine protease
LPRRSEILAAVTALALLFPCADQARADPLPSEQWAIAPGTVFDLPGAWQLSQGAGVIVAVIDSGARLEHADLAPNVWRNPYEMPGNRRDDDGNGYVDDAHGVNLTRGGSHQDLHDGFGHGTHVSGTIAAAGSPGGVVGVAYRATLMTVKVLDDRGGGSTIRVAEGIRYAAANGARIINLSVNSPDDDPRVRAAIEAAAAADVLIVCSAGNGGRDLDRTRLFPVSIAAPNLIGVAATGQANQYALESFSNYGRLTVPVAAPGADVVSTSRTGGYESKSGTSMAAPHVTGVAALMAAAAPELTAHELRALLLEHAVHTDAPVGAGIVDALGSVSAATLATTRELGRPPGVRVLLATRRGRVLRVQVALRGPTAAVHQYVVRLDGRVVISAPAGRRVQTIAWRGRAGRRVSVAALSADGRTIATAAAPVTAGRP